MFGICKAARSMGKHSILVLRGPSLNAQWPQALEPGSPTRLTAWIRPTQGPTSLLLLAAAKSGWFPLLVARQNDQCWGASCLVPLRNHNQVGYRICLIPSWHKAPHHGPDHLWIFSQPVPGLPECRTCPSQGHLAAPWFSLPACLCSVFQLHPWQQSWSPLSLNGSSSLGHPCLWHLPLTMSSKIQTFHMTQYMLLTGSTDLASFPTKFTSEKTAPQGSSSRHIFG